MRGCLSVLVLGAVFLAGLTWFAGPPVASGVVTKALQGSGLAADDLNVQVTADPPLELAVGRADQVAVHATTARWRGVRLASLDLTLDAVDLLGRTATSAEGRLDGVELDTAGGQTVLADFEFEGSAEAATTTIRIGAANVEAVTIDAFEAHFGVRPSSARLVAPNTVRVVLGGLTIDSRLSIDPKGSVVATARGDSIVLFTPGAALPLHLTSLAVTSSGLELRGTLDVGALLR
jgi:hypothetical protein